MEARSEAARIDEREPCKHGLNEARKQVAHTRAPTAGFTTALSDAPMRTDCWSQREAIVDPAQLSGRTRGLAAPRIGTLERSNIRRGTCEANLMRAKSALKTPEESPMARRTKEWLASTALAVCLSLGAPVPARAGSAFRTISYRCKPTRSITAKRTASRAAP